MPFFTPYQEHQQELNPHQAIGQDTRNPQGKPFNSYCDTQDINTTTSTSPGKFSQSRQYGKKEIFKCRKRFPEILMCMLSCEEVHDAMSWAPSGTCFAIHNQTILERDVLPTYFRQSTFQSFKRKLIRWGFCRIIKGRDKGAFYHEFFHADMPHLCLRIACNKKSVSSPASSQCDDKLVPSTSGYYGQETVSLKTEKRYFIRESCHYLSTSNLQNLSNRCVCTHPDPADPCLCLFEKQQKNIINLACEMDINYRKQLLLSSDSDVIKATCQLQCNNLKEVQGQQESRFNAAFARLDDNNRKIAMMLKEVSWRNRLLADMLEGV